MVGIVCALSRELAPLQRRRPQGCRIVVAGIGAEAAERGARSLVRGERLSVLISAGYAGGLVAEAVPGTVVVDTDNKELEALLPPALRGRVAHSQKVLRNSTERARLAAATGAVAVDMESAAVARVAADYGLPFAAVRAITDGPEMELALPWDSFRRPDGSLRTAAILLGALRTPKGMAELRQLWYASRDASKALCSFLGRFLERWNMKSCACAQK